MKSHWLQVAKLSRFKSGPNISVSYVSFLYATRDLFIQLGLPILRVRNEKNRLSQIRLDGVSACTVLRPEYKTHKQKDANSYKAL